MRRRKSFVAACHPVVRAVSWRFTGVVMGGAGRRHGNRVSKTEPCQTRFQGNSPLLLCNVSCAKVRIHIFKRKQQQQPSISFISSFYVSWPLQGEVSFISNIQDQHLSFFCHSLSYQPFDLPNSFYSFPTFPPQPVINTLKGKLTDSHDWLVSL